jgi:hypothetical protein
MVKYNKVEVQKGEKIKPEQPNYRYMTRQQIDREDIKNDHMRADMKRMTLHTPKQ